MIAESYKQAATQIIKAVIHAIHEKNYKDIPNLIDRSDIPMDELEEFIEETLRLQNRPAVDLYDAPSIIHHAKEDTLLFFYEDEDGEGFEAEYSLMTAGKPLCIVLIFEFIITENGLHCILEDADTE